MMINKDINKAPQIVRSSNLKSAFANLIESENASGSILGYSEPISTAVFSDTTNFLSRSIHKLQSSTLSSVSAVPVNIKTIEEQLFDASVNVKVLTSKVTMHLNPNFRAKLFTQIDYLHDLDEWDPDDKPIQLASFNTFLRTIIHIDPEKYPSLGLSYTGNLLGAWVVSNDKLSVEFLPNDELKWVLSKQFEGTTERSAGQVHLKRFKECLTPYHPEEWFYN